MTIRDVKGEVDDRIPVNTVLLSVYNKTGLDELVLGLLQQNPEILFLSTGGTYKHIRDKILGSVDTHLMEVSEYTGFPEMEGGLVKTLHPKIHAGILGERHNSEHQKYLQDMNGRFIDMVVVNLYPFEKKIAEPGCTFEQARGNIDIGGPTMVRAAAKNFMSCAVVVNPDDYDTVLGEIERNQGTTIFNTRLTLAQRAFDTTARYESQIANYMRNIGLVGDIRTQYKISEEVGKDGS